eukprot:767411-Hanusia_phi.AAC.1
MQPQLHLVHLEILPGHSSCSQRKKFSMVHVDEQPSPLMPFPSSHSSPSSTTPSPQASTDSHPNPTYPALHEQRPLVQVPCPEQPAGQATASLQGALCPNCPVTTREKF